MIRILRGTEAQRIALGGLQPGRAMLCTDSLKTYIGTASGDIETTGGSSGFLDNFNDGARYWAWNDAPKNGSITETGTYLELKGTAAQDCNWWGAGVDDAPVAFIGTHTCPMEAITKLIFHTTNPNSQSGMYISNAPLLGGNSGYLVARDEAQHIIVSQLGVGNIADSGGVIALPVWLRIRTRGEGNGNITDFHYSIDGITYISLISVNNLPHRGVGLFSKNWSTPGPEIIGRFDFFSITLDPGPS